MFIGMLVFWGLIIAGIVMLVRVLAGNRGGGASSQDRETPLEIAQKRYARGEITQQEYERLKAELER